MRLDVFVSHSSRDKTVADALVATLERERIRCWVAPRDILPGQDWSTAIIDAISASRVMVLILSGQSNCSEQVKREVATAVDEAKPIIPFRIEDVPLSKHMRYFISTPHWLDALTPPLEQHLKLLAETVRMLLSVTAEAAGPKTISPEPPAPMVPKEEARPDQIPEPSKSDAPKSQLSLRFCLDGHVRNVCLLAGSCVRLGKDRANDIVLRVLPRSPLNDERTARISRRHAELRFAEGTVDWHNLECPNGTLVDGEMLPAGARVALHDGVLVSPAGVLDMACDLYADSEVAAVAPESVSREEPCSTMRRPVAVRLRRLDSLAGLEQYVVFEQRIAVGRAVDCPVLIPDASLAERHATIVRTDSGLEIEAGDSDSPTRVDRQLLASGQTALLRPGSSVRLGEVELEVSIPWQLHLGERST